MAEIKKNWIIFLMSMMVSVGTALLVQSFTKINESATIEYVDKGDEKLDCKIEAQRLEVDENLEKKADKTTVKQMQHTLDVIDGRIYDMWKDSHENK